MLLHCVRHPEDLAYDAWFEEQVAAGRPWRYLPVVSRPPEGGWSGRTGHVQYHLGEVGPTAEDALMVCGSPAMVDETKARLHDAGVPADRILTEEWG